MDKVEYNSLGLKRLEDTISFTWNNINIKVKKYFPISDIYDVIMITLQKSYEDGIYNPIKLDEYLILNLVYMFSNIEFSEEDREDEDKLFDELQSSGFIDKFLSVVDKRTYDDLCNTIDTLVSKKESYANTFAGTIKKLIEDMSINSEEIQKIVDNFDKEKFKEVIDFATAANGGREIN